MTNLYRITVAVSTITLAVPEGQTPGLYRYQLYDDTNKLLNQQDITALQIVFDSLPAGYYVIISYRVDTNGRQIGNAFSKGIVIDDSLQNTYEAISYIEVSAFRQ